LEGGIPAILAGLKVHSGSLNYHIEACKFLVKLSQNGIMRFFIFLLFAANNVMAIIRANGVNDALLLINKPGNREILLMALKFMINLSHSGNAI
jgi:hypothetical protein